MCNMYSIPATPYFVIKKSILDEGILELKEALSEYWNNYIVGYSYKTNSLQWVIRYMKEQGFYAEVVSEDEYDLARSIGYVGSIIYNGPVKGKTSFFEALLNKNIVNIDSKYEIDWIKEFQKEKPDETIELGVRINFDIERACEGETTTGTEGGRFGFSYETGEAYRVIEEINAIPNVSVVGLHLHCSSKTRSLNIYKAIAQMACTIKRETKLEFQYVDVGGGFFGGLANKPHYADYMKVIAEELKKEYDVRETKLIVEPGTSLICAPIDFVTSVLDVKETNRNRFVITDGSRINIDPLMSKKSYFYHIEYQPESEQRKVLEKQVISGFTCMEHDRLFELRDDKELLRGDRIIYEKVGAYTICLSPLFIQYFPVVYLEDGNRLEVVREKWNVEYYKQGSVERGIQE